MKQKNQRLPLEHRYELRRFFMRQNSIMTYQAVVVEI